MCQGYLADDLIEPDGATEIAVADLPLRLANVLPGLCFDIARFFLADGETGEDDIVRQQYKAAIHTLMRIADRPNRATVVATIEDGVNAGRYIPGIDGTIGDGDDVEVLQV